MIDWLAANSTLVNILLNGAMTLIWLIYLHLLLSSTRRSRRTNIFVNRSADRGDKAECVVTNMGAEPIYLIDVIAELIIDGKNYSTVVTDREELDVDDVTNMLERSNQVALDRGESRAIGNFRNLVWRAIKHLDLRDCEDRITDLRLIVVVAGHENRIAAAEKEYYVVSQGDGGHSYVPQGLMTRQLHSARTRRRIQKLMEENLRLESEEARRQAGQTRLAA
ncbi:hypothetical protein GE300_00325 [Rhodobacteraceae bacterium 2CG4]|uniref:Uncharacterized protein n=1 Tax=Halovulum marinum TaxID=2662447 RepID=A0A6L5YUU7_9RHOB|nr:hypothetical protein [Halovulum marinum]MSU88058.1 hypothetical protein [Halovulum marinum]